MAESQDKDWVVGWVEGLQSRFGWMPPAHKISYDKQFFILAKGRSPFHLSTLEAIFIKTSNRSCADKKNLFTISRCFLINLFVLYSRASRIYAINIHTLNCFPSFWRFLPMSVRRKSSKKWIHYFQQYFVPPKIFLNIINSTLLGNELACLLIVW